MALIGQVAPDFLLKDDQGQPRSLTDFLKVGPVMLVFYPGDFQPICKKQLCSYQEAYDRFKHYGIQPIGISSNSVEEHANFRKEYSISFPLLSDPKKETFKSYQVTSLFMLGGASRAVLFVGRSGTVLYRYVEPTTLSRRKPGELLQVLDELKRQAAI